VQALVNLKWTTVRLTPLIRPGYEPVRLDYGLYDLEFEYDCDAPKCKIEIITTLLANGPYASAGASRVLFQSVVDGGMGRFFKFEEGTTLELLWIGFRDRLQTGRWITNFTDIHLSRWSSNHVASGPALSVLDADAAGTSGESEREKEFEDGEGVKLTICLSPVDANGMPISTVKQTTCLRIGRMGTPPTSDEDGIRPWVVKVVKREATFSKSNPMPTYELVKIDRNSGT